MEESIVVSVIIPVKNGGHYFRLCLDSLLLQDFLYNWEISVYDDGSTDNEDVIGDYLELFQQKGVNIVLNRGEKSLGVGYAKNRAVRASSGKYLCFCDADDISYPSRISEQYKSAIDLENKFHTELLFLGCKFIRHPEHSTKRYTDWANSIDPTLLKTQIYTSHGPTLIAPTWFISRKLYDFLDGFREFPIGFPEDLEFFYRCIDTNCAFHRVEKCLVMYRYHLTCTSLGVSEDTIWKMRIERLATEVLERWNAFTIWNAGKQGKRFFKSLNNLQQQKVVAFCDVDSKKINRGVYEIYDDVLRCVSNKIPIIDVKKAVPPVIVCVKLDMSGGQLEELLAFTGWKEGCDYILFS